MAKLRVATVITRFNGGAGLVALNGLLALDPGSYERTVVTGGPDLDGADGITGDLTPKAYAGLPWLRAGRHLSGLVPAAAY